MNPIGSIRAGLPATAVFELAPAQRLTSPPPGAAQAGETLLAAVKSPPRAGAARPIAAIIPQVLARYGLADEPSPQEPYCNPLDLLA